MRVGGWDGRWRGAGTARADGGIWHARARQGWWRGQGSGGPASSAGGRQDPLCVAGWPPLPRRAGGVEHRRRTCGRLQPSRPHVVFILGARADHPTRQVAGGRELASARRGGGCGARQAPHGGLAPAPQGLPRARHRQLALTGGPARGQGRGGRLAWVRAGEAEFLVLPPPPRPASWLCRVPPRHALGPASADQTHQLMLRAHSRQCLHPGLVGIAGLGSSACKHGRGGRARELSRQVG